MDLHHCRLMLIWPCYAEHSHVKKGDMHLLKSSQSRTTAKHCQGSFSSRGVSLLAFLRVQTFSFIPVPFQSGKQAGYTAPMSSANPTPTRFTQHKSLWKLWFLHLHPSPPRHWLEVPNRESHSFAPPFLHRTALRKKVLSTQLCCPPSPACEDNFWQTNEPFLPSGPSPTR